MDQGVTAVASAAILNGTFYILANDGIAPGTTGPTFGGEKQIAMASIGRAVLRQCDVVIQPPANLHECGRKYIMTTTPFISLSSVRLALNANQHTYYGF